MQSLTLSKLASMLEKFKPYLYQAERPVEGLEWSPEPPPGALPDRLSGYGGWQPIRPGQSWGGPDMTGWFRGRLRIPEDWAGQRVVLKLRFGAYHDISEPEALVYLDGREAQALDKFHQRVVLTGRAQGGETFELAVEAYSGVKNERPELVECALAAVNRPAEAYFFNTQAGLMAANEISSAELLHHELAGLLNRAYGLVDLSMPGSEAFRSSLAEANALLESGYRRLLELAPPQRPAYTITGHSHIDVAWLWPLRQTRRKAARTFSTVLKLMDEYPGYHFTQSQPQLYQFVKEDQPDLYRRIQARAAEGRWEPTGVMWVESDCNLTGGESLARQFLYGQRFLEREFGRRSRVLWLPDAFGFGPALPQLMRSAGADYFMTTKLSWSQSNRFPSDTFWWEGLDGTRVLAHFVTTPAQDGESWHTYNGSFNGAEVAGLWRVYRQKEASRELLYLYGWGDGGGGPTYEMLERAERWQDFPGLPRCEQGSAEAFFERLESRVAGRPLPDYYGELYLEYHQGTFTSQGWLKRANRRNEFRLREAEIYSCWAALPDNPVRSEELAAAWEKLLLNQFHDILPGSSIGAVYDDARRDQAFISQTALSVRDRALERLAAGIGGAGWAIFNPLSWNRSEPLLLQAAGLPPNLAGPDGKRLAVQAVEGGALVSGLELPPLGYAFVREAAGEAAPEAELTVSAEPAALENRFLRIEFDRQGEICSIFDKEAGREVVAPGRSVNRLVAYEDRPRRFTAWNIEPYYREKATPLNGISRLEVIEQGPVRASLAIERRYLNSTIVQRVSLWAGSRRLDFATTIDWQERLILLKAHFPLAIHAAHATFDVAFGNLARPTHANTSWEQALYEVCAHKWADLSEGDYGVSLLNDGKYGHSVERNVLSLTLLKSANAPDPQADLGWHEFTYSLYPHPGDWRGAGTVRRAYELNANALAARLPGGPNERPAGALLRNERAGVIVETVKPAEDGAGLVVRLYECHNRRGPDCLIFERPPRAAWECNLLEDRLGPAELDGPRLNFDIRPYEIKTFRIEF